MFGVSPKKEKKLLERMEKLGIKREDLIERFTHSRGRGGQKVNKSLTCVYVKHVPTNIEVKCDITRSQAINRFLARRILVEKIEGVLMSGKDEKRRKILKFRKQKRKAYKRAKMKTINKITGIVSATTKDMPVDEI